MKKLLFLLLLVGITTYTQAQPPPGEGPPGNPTGDPEPVPITGIEMLVGIGSLFGVSRLLKNRTKYKDN